jgi:GH15 family glucan-1,4-alpha-glucosidase
MSGVANDPGPADRPPNQPSLDLWPIGNCQVAGLIDRSGSLVWGCVPRLDGDPAFCALLDDKSRRSTHGFWAIGLEDSVGITQQYIRNTPMLVTRHTDAQGGVIEVVDFCPRGMNHGRMYRPVAFARIVRRLAGSPRIRVALRPAATGASKPVATSGSHHIRYLLSDLTLR